MRVNITPEDLVAAAATLPSQARAGIDEVIAVALAAAPDVKNALALLVSAVGELANATTRPSDLRQAAAFILDEWPDRALRPSQVQRAQVWADAFHPPTPIAAAEVIAAAHASGPDDRHDLGPAPVVSEIRLPDPPAYPDDDEPDDFDPEATLDGGDADD